MTSVSAYPLSWPATMPRARGREAGQFRTTLTVALENVESSLRLFGRDSGKAVSGVVLSSNVTLGQTKPDDPGVAVWFTWDGDQVCIPVDRYTTPAANLQAIHHVLEARRVELRHGTLALVKATFAGFKALPPPPSAKPWTDVLELPQGASRDAINAAFREKMKTAHPDRGGSADAVQRLTDARDQALGEAST